MTDLVRPAEWYTYLLQTGPDGSDPDYILLWGRTRAAIGTQADPTLPPCHATARAALQRGLGVPTLTTSSRCIEGARPRHCADGPAARDAPGELDP